MSNVFEEPMIISNKRPPTRKIVFVRDSIEGYDMLRLDWGRQLVLLMTTQTVSEAIKFLEIGDHRTLLAPLDSLATGWSVTFPVQVLFTEAAVRRNLDQKPAPIYQALGRVRRVGGKPFPVAEVKVSAKEVAETGEVVEPHPRPVYDFARMLVAPPEPKNGYSDVGNVLLRYCQGRISTAEALQELDYLRQDYEKTPAWAKAYKKGTSI